MGFFARRSCRPTRRQFLTLEKLEDRTLLSGDLLLTTEVPGAIKYNLMQYTQGGTQVSSQNIPQSPTATEYQEARGLTVDPSGNVHIFDGTMSPFLDTYSPGGKPAWSYQTTPGWAVGSNISYGEVAAYKNFVFASNMQTLDGVGHGIVRFDTTGGSPVLFAPNTGSLQITLGLDGELYELESGSTPTSVPNIQVYNPDTLALVRSINLALPSGSDIRSIAVDGAGNIYAADWWGTLTKYDPSGALLKTQTGYSENLMNVAIDTDGQIAVGGRNGGVYLTDESLSSLRVINTGQWNAFVTFDHYIGVANNASFLKTDTLTQGNWQGVYGSQGYNVIDNAVNYPSYASVSASGNLNAIWSTSTTDPRALQDAVGSGRTAACWVSYNSFTVNVNITDGQTHQLALYLLDWDQNGARSERVDILNAATGSVLDSQTVSGFQNGEYLVWNISGNVIVRVTNLDDPNNTATNAVLSGLFFDPKGTAISGSGSATFLKSDISTQGNWQGVYGSQGYNVIDNAVNYPSYATVSASGNANAVWSSSTTDPRALQDASGSGRIAACWVSASSFNVNVNITDGQTHQLALYLLDWDQNGARSERVDIIDASTGSVLSTQTVSGFQNGQYLVWNVSGNVVIRVTNLDNPNNTADNAVLSGLFFDPKGSAASGSGSATFLKSDTTTHGNWQGVYGSQGYNVIDNAVNYPTYATVSASGNANAVWSTSTTDPRALQDASGSGRIAACWVSASSFNVNVNITDGQTHQLALYLLDWDQGGARSERVDILDASTGSVLSTQTLSGFQNGEYLVWNISGNVIVRITNLDDPNNSATNAVLSGLFFDA